MTAILSCIGNFNLCHFSRFSTKLMACLGYPIPCVYCFRAAMRNSGVSECQPSFPVAHATDFKATSKRLRCQLCPRGVDRKVACTCTSCSRPVCPQHSQLQVVCNDCY